MYVVNAERIVDYNVKSSKIIYLGIYFCFVIFGFALFCVCVCVCVCVCWQPVSAYKKNVLSRRVKFNDNDMKRGNMATKSKAHCVFHAYNDSNSTEGKSTLCLYLFIQLVFVRHSVKTRFCIENKKK